MTVHYLGNKRRIVDTIINLLQDYVDDAGTVCDLFTGTGIVANAMSANWRTYACDIQEYARVLCSALILPDAELVIANDFREIYDALYGEILDIIAPLAKFEQRSVMDAERGEFAPLADIIEHGYLLEAYRSRDFMPQDTSLRKALETVRASLAQREHHKNAPSMLITKYFGGIYFSYAQAAALDALWNALAQTTPHSDVGKASLLVAASMTIDTVGNTFAQPLHVRDTSGCIKRSTLRKALHDRSKDVWEEFERAHYSMVNHRHPRENNIVAREDAAFFLRGFEDNGESQKTYFDAIYADPPYSRYHYSRYYHGLETIILHDNPKVTENPATGKPSRGIYRANRYQSPFSTRMGAHDAFVELLETCSRVTNTLILSYSPYPHGKRSTPRMVTIGELKDIASHTFTTVDVIPVVGVSHSRFNNQEFALDRDDISEVLLLCRK